MHATHNSLQSCHATGLPTYQGKVRTSYIVNHLSSTVQCPGRDTRPVGPVGSSQGTSSGSSKKSSISLHKQRCHKIFAFAGMKLEKVVCRGTWRAEHTTFSKFHFILFAFGQKGQLCDAAVDVDINDDIKMWKSVTSG